MASNIYFLSRHNTDEKFILSPNQDKFRIGRSPDCDIILKSIFVSRQQCEIKRLNNDGIFQLKNISKTNSTHLDNLILDDIHSVTEVRVGSLIGLGVPVEFVNETNPDYIFLRLCKEADIVQNEKPYLKDVSPLKERKYTDSAFATSDIPIRGETKELVKRTILNVPVCNNTRNVIEKSALEHSSSDDCVQRLPNVNKRKHSVSDCDEDYDLIVIEDDSPEKYSKVLSSIKKCIQNSSDSKIESKTVYPENILKQEENYVNDSSELKLNTILTKETKVNIKNDQMPINLNIKTTLISSESSSKVDSMLSDGLHRPNVKISKNDLPINGMQKNNTDEIGLCLNRVDDSKNKNVFPSGKLLDCPESDIHLRVLETSVLPKSPEHIKKNLSLTSCKNVNSRSNSLVSVPETVSQYNHSIQVDEYEFVYSDQTPDDSLLEQEVEFEPICQDDFIKKKAYQSDSEDIKPNLKLLNTRVIKSASITEQNMNQSTGTEINFIEKRLEKLPKSLSSYDKPQVKPIHNSKVTDNSVIISPVSQCQLMVKPSCEPTGKSFQPMTYLPSTNLDMNSNKYFNCPFPTDISIPPQLSSSSTISKEILVDSSLKRSNEFGSFNNEDESEKSFKKHCSDPIISKHFVKDSCEVVMDDHLLQKETLTNQANQNNFKPLSCRKGVENKTDSCYNNTSEFPKNDPLICTSSIFTSINSECKSHIKESMSFSSELQNAVKPILTSRLKYKDLIKDCKVVVEPLKSLDAYSFDSNSEFKLKEKPQQDKTLLANFTDKPELLEPHCLSEKKTEVILHSNKNVTILETSIGTTRNKSIEINSDKNNCAKSLDHKINSDSFQNNLANNLLLNVNVVNTSETTSNANIDMLDKVLNPSMHEKIDSLEPKDCSNEEVVKHSWFGKLKKFDRKSLDNVNSENYHIKKEKLDLALDNEQPGTSGLLTTLKVKEEPMDTSELAPDKEYESDDDDDIGIINYSQMDDVIYISSDDENDSSFLDGTPNSSKDISFGPLPPCPDIDLNIVEMNKKSNILQHSSKESHKNAEIDLNMFEKLVPIGNEESSFLDGSDNSNREAILTKTENSFEKVISLTKTINEVNGSNDDIDDWWPCLSQAFDDNEEMYESNEVQQNSFPCMKDLSKGEEKAKTDLDHVIEKIDREKTKKVMKSILTVPLIPPVNKKLRVTKEKRKIKTHVKDCIPSTTNRPSANEDYSKKNEWIDKCSKSNKRKKSKNGSGNKNLRNQILKTHDLEPYKKVAANNNKECHHLIPAGKDKPNLFSKIKENEPSKKINPNYKKEQHEKLTGCSSNISVKPKSSVPKGIAKNSKISRSQKLTEINLFPSPAKAKSKTKINYKIPKKYDKENELTCSGPVQANNTDSVLEKRFPICVPLAVSSVDCAKLGENSTATSITNEVVAAAPNLISSGILKSITTKLITRPKYCVRFPEKEDDLVRIKVISPRAKSNKNGFSGPSNVRLKETFAGNLCSSQLISNNDENPQEFILKICNWNYDWLFTYHKAQSDLNCTRAPNPPQVCENKMLPTLIVYKSYSDYKGVFSNLMYYEAWENVYRQWEQYSSTNVWFLSQVDTFHIGYIKTNYKPQKYFTIKIIVPITREWSSQGKHPNQGSLIAIKHKFNNKTIHTFGFVQQFVKRNSAKYIPQELKAICKNNEDTVLVLEVTCSKLYLENSIKRGMLVSISNVSYIRPCLRAFEALCHLKKSPLCSFLINPSNLNALKEYNKRVHYVIPAISVNDIQKDAIIKVSDKCTTNLEEPKISLIHGPPGTGKTRTIIALVAQINLLCKENAIKGRRILLCAPSNAAVDELTYRLMKLKEVDINLNIVRVGVRQSIGQQVLDCFLDTKVQKEFDRSIMLPQNKSLQLELQNRRIYAREATDAYEKAVTEQKSKSEIYKLELRMIELLRAEIELKNSSKIHLSHEDRIKELDKCKRKVLEQAEVITCTLNSCLSGLIYEVFANKSKTFSCCIVDEAGQCTETETWMPLQLGIKKLILVGDHLQLPATVLSNVAQGKKLHQSLFERIYHHIGIEMNRMDILHSLTLQYRMHNDICDWPSTHFYHKTLTTAPGINEERSCFLKPYLVFDLEDSLEIKNNNQGEIYNMIEVQAIVSLIECLASKIEKFSIGILTPYQKQKIYLTEKLRPFKKLQITVSTIDNFQGQEKDFIICSFVRANIESKLGFVSDRQRLNVALTRARRALFLFGHLRSLKSNEDWKSLIANAQSRKLIQRVTSTKLAKDKGWLLNMVKSKTVL